MGGGDPGEEVDDLFAVEVGDAEARVRGEEEGVAVASWDYGSA